MAAPQSALAAIFKAIRRFASNPEAEELAVQRARMLADQADVSRYSPAAIGRATTGTPAAQRGFSESLITDRAPFGTTLIKPSQWAEHTPPLDEFRDRNIIEYLKNSIQKDKVKDLPAMWINDRPSGFESGFEGRHRMKALQELYGDEGVPVNLLPGNEYKMQPFGPRRIMDEAIQGPNRKSPLEMIQGNIQFGDKPIKVNPLWLGENAEAAAKSPLQSLHPLDVVGPDQWRSMVKEWASLPGEKPPLTDWAWSKIR